MTRSPWRSRQAKGRAAVTVLATAAVLATTAALALGAAGCGGSDQTTTAETTPAPVTAAGRHSELVGGGRTGSKSPANPAPKASSLVVQEIYRQFPPPEPEPGVSGSAAAIRAGERACAGKTPVEVKEETFAAAVGSGNLDPASPEGKLIAQIERFESRVTKEPSFTAGQLAADSYKATLPAGLAASGYQGCVYALAKELERRLAAGG